MSCAPLYLSVLHVAVQLHGHLPGRGTTDGGDRDGQSERRSGRRDSQPHEGTGQAACTKRSVSQK